MGYIPEKGNDLPRCQLRVRVVEFWRELHTHLLGLGDDARSNGLAEVLSALPTASMSIVHAGTGSALTVAHVFGSRGMASEKT